eukprot:CAMPEP_0197673368 /NCGR_PEP_ID=MMETSP1338-20131121/80801_1 /TAXON_ID=43686 ORGANISM="Pelagodinium beii, Strain RCC1491" /NCGR_SAMPLE_ID=MMETSP1338 /ASSEMBLY_ACC=CAM_ASM_000754 /LENGTH=293 /DNA_ID=CAMNT_0043253607 /DNA_START=161 /DNA_END=1039 /DNA_ORIENTATION=-
MGMLQAASRMNNSWGGLGSRRRRTFAAPISATRLESREVLMAKIAKFVYTFAAPAGPWVLAKTWDQRSQFFGGKDRLAIYQSGNQCVVAFAGTDDVSDLSDDLDVRDKEACGHSFHKGIYEEFQNFLSGKKWSSEFQPYLKSDACSGGIIAVGHSLGGALASVLATCANAPGNPLGTQLGFLITSLYTIGAPALAKSSPRNGQTSSGCFNGARFFIEDSQTYDPVSYAAVRIGFEHPRVKAIRLHSDSDDRLSFDTFSCESDEARLNSDEPGMQFPSKNDHLATTYISRIEKL